MYKLLVVLYIITVYFEKGVSQECIIRRRGITVIERNLILSYHNFVRSRLALGCLAPSQPKAGNMKMLSWDGQLANYAQNIANSCKFQGLKPKDPRWKNTGFNYFVLATPAQGPTCSDWPRALEAWWSLRNNYTYPNYNPRVYPYLQLVVAETRHVGCGYSCFQDSNRRTLKLHLCLYGPTVKNISTVPPYRQGKGCVGLCE